MRVLEWREAARADLLAIIDFISDDSPDAAQRLKDDIETKVSKRWDLAGDRIAAEPGPIPRGRSEAQYLPSRNVFTGMDAAFRKNDPMADREHGLTQAVLRERTRLRNFVRKRVPDPADAEDILQDVLFEFVEAYRLPAPIEQVGAWLFRVARNRIIDRFRKIKEQPLDDRSAEDIEGLWLPEALLRTDDGPEAAYARQRLLERVNAALGALPQEQRAVFIAHEIEGRSFRDIANESGVPVNTLLGRKRYAVLRLRAQLKDVQDGLR